MNLLIYLVLCLYLLPGSVLAQTVTTTVVITRDPLKVELAQYALVLGFSMLGGFVAYMRKVAKGEIAKGSLSALIGELATSAFSGMLAFYACEYMNFDRFLTACVAGLAGHAGGTGIAWLEKVMQKRAERMLGVTLTAPAPLGAPESKD